MNAISRMAPVTNAPVRLPDTVKSLSKIPSGIRRSLLGTRIMAVTSIQKTVPTVCRCEFRVKR